MNKKQFWKDFKSAEHLHTFLIRWAIIVGAVIFLLLTVQRYKVHIECDELLDTYSRSHYIQNCTPDTETELSTHKDPWGDPYYIKYQRCNGKDVEIIYSKNGGHARRNIGRY